MGGSSGDGPRLHFTLHEVEYKDRKMCHCGCYSDRYFTVSGSGRDGFTNVDICQSCVRRMAGKVEENWHMDSWLKAQYECPTCHKPIKWWQRKEWGLVSYRDGSPRPRRYHEDCLPEGGVTYW